ncbi:MAG: hypothetical protein HYZ75_17985 [Elusimicrobia bacterium]|nr:hypothetical protein [Elusimicrobiota bacterium]
MKVLLVGAAFLLLTATARAQNAMPSFYYDNLKAECDPRGGGACCKSAIDEMKLAQATPATENGMCLPGHTVVRPACRWAIAWCKPEAGTAKSVDKRQTAMKRGEASPWTSGGSFDAKVVAVKGPTELVVLQNGRHRHRIILRGVVAPKPGSKHYKGALNLARKLALGKAVNVEMFHSETTDQRRQIVVVGGEFSLANALAAEGLVRWDAQADPINRQLQGAEAAAKRAGKGLWAKK